MRIAVIGSGISGLASAYLLAPYANVTLYESSNTLGGHAHTAHIDVNGTMIDVDTGFMVYNPERYPHLVSLFNALDIETVETVMSFSVSIPGIVEYSSDVLGICGDMYQLVRPSYWRLLREIPRFNRAAKRYLKEPQASRDLVLSDFLSRNGFSHELVHWYLYPMMGSIWSGASGSLGDYPAFETFKFLDNHLLLNLFFKPRWRTVRGGSTRYVRTLEQILLSDGVTIKTGQRVHSIQRGESNTVITTSGEDHFDRIVIATHADMALSILADASDNERALLGAFSYSKNNVVLHGDTSFMPSRKNAWASWNYHGTHKDSQTISLTYYMNALQHIPRSHPVFVTLNPDRSPRPDAVYATYQYDHPVFNAAARSAQLRLKDIQGNLQTYFVGAHLGYGFHEDGIASAVDIVRGMGVPLRITV